MDDNETVNPCSTQVLPSSLQARFASAKARVQEAKDILADTLCEMIEAGQAKKIEDCEGNFPDIVIVAPVSLLARIENYDFDENGMPSWLDGDGYKVHPAAWETVEWF